MPITNFCPGCGCRLDCHTGVNDRDAVPQEGDFSICIKCGQFLQYGGGDDLKAADVSQMVESGLSLELIAKLFVAKHYILVMKHERN